MRHRRLIPFGDSVYPSPTAHHKGEQLGHTPLRYCVQCGTLNDTRKTAWSDSGDGLGEAFTVSVTAFKGQTQHDTKDRNVQSGCVNCGSLLWQYSKPEILPDDRNMPSEEWRRNKRRRR